MRVGTRVRAKTNRRVGTITSVQRIGGRKQYEVSYDEAPQDRYIAWPRLHGAEFPEDLLEPER